MLHCSVRVGIGKRLKKILPYWLTGREERCAGCGQPHAHGTTVHCVACDRAFCTFCVAIAGGEVFCAGCHEEGGAR